jgi:hypothetical protein
MNTDQTKQDWARQRAADGSEAIRNAQAARLRAEALKRFDRINMPWWRRVLEVLR